MGMLNNSNAIESGGYNIDRSLRFRSSASAYLNRTPASAGSRTTWTWSKWIKRGALGAVHHLFMSGSTPNDYTSVFFQSDDTLLLQHVSGGAVNSNKRSAAVYRDPSAWYHIVAVWDTTNATADDRMRVYVNGNRITQFIGSNLNPALNTNSYINAAALHTISRSSEAAANYFDGYLAEVNFIDGQALTPSSFGETDAITGAWIPKKYTGTYGTNGFYLDFKDNTSATTLAYDKSGNGNNWTANNISTTAGSTYDVMTDVPTLTSATTANYATWNPIFISGNSAYSLPATVSNGNLYLYDTSSSNRLIASTMALPSTGKIYFETTWSQISSVNGFFGLSTNNMISVNGYYRSNGVISNTSGVAQTSGGSWSNNDVIAVAVDVDAGTVQFYKNNVAQGSTPSYTFTANTVLYAYVAFDNSAGTKECWGNFGQQPFAYTPPTGFKALNTFNLPDPTIKKPNQYMDATLYTGNGSTQSVTNAGGFQPDLVWVKIRSAALQHRLFDSVRGATKWLETNGTTAETTDVQSLTSFNSNGFSLGSDSTTNYNAGSLIGWQWKESATAGFDIVTYTGTGSARTVAHNLGVAPKMMIVKERNNSRSWNIYHSSLGPNIVLYLDTTGGGSSLSTVWNDTNPTSSVFTVGTALGTNESGGTYVAYLFAEIAGYSKFGSYTGNGSADGPFVYCGFRPKFVMVKRSTGAGADWEIHDTSRNNYNVTDATLRPNASSAEFSYAAIDVTSNGFKLRDNSVTSNSSGDTFIYAAFAESPFKTSLAR